jgi:Cu-Zn family superoxide dismutase
MKKKMFPILFIMCLGLSACSGNPDQSGMKSGQKEKARAVSNQPSPQSMLIPLKNQQGKKSGQARLVQTPQGVKITVQASGLKPGKHGIHIHEKGKCVSPDFKSAGEHFNPFGKEHGLANPRGPHAGDLPNIVVGQNGKVNATFLARNVTLMKGKKNSLLDRNGSALIIHSQPDDNKSQPSGNSGARVMCGKIKK